MEQKIKVRVYHREYGCDTGCCGHVVEIKFPDGSTGEAFDFYHHGAVAEVKKVIKENWPDCVDSIDWDTIDFSEARENC